MDINGFLTALQDTPVATAILEGDDLFPWIETIHVLAVVTVVGTISIIDLRLIGVAAHTKSVQRLMRQLLPLTWSAFSIALLAGLLMFSSKAVKYAANVPFRIKMLLLLAAGINMIIFHFVTYRTVDAWDEGRTPTAARVAGFLSLSLWIVVIIFGRWIGFTIV